MRHIDRDHAAGKRKAPAKVTASQRQQAQQEAQGGPIRANPAMEQHRGRPCKDVQRAYGQIARELAKGDGDDKRLAVDIVKLVQQMLLPLSKHEQRVQALQEAGRSRSESAGREQARRPSATPERPRSSTSSRRRSQTKDETSKNIDWHYLNSTMQYCFNIKKGAK